MQRGELEEQTYLELKKVASYYMFAERGGHTLSPTALVNEAYLKFQASNHVDSELQFKHVAARNMRQILVDHARARAAKKRGGEQTAITITEEALTGEDQDWDIIALNEAMEKLARVDEVKARIVDLRYFAGCKNEEIAELLDISLATVKRKWSAARAWLYREINAS